MSKRIFAIILTVIALVGAIAAVSFGSVASAEGGASFFYINNESDWEAFIARAAEGTSDRSQFINTVVLLGTDLYFYRRYDDPDYLGKRNSVLNDFKGTFEGNGHSLVGLRYSSNVESGALFGNLDGTIRNLNIVDIQIKVLPKEGISPIRSGLVLNNRGSIYNVNIQGTIEGDRIGGIAHNNTGTISGCISAVQNDSQGNFFGTIAGANYATIQDNYAVYGAQVYYNHDTATTLIIPEGTPCDDGYIDSFFEMLFVDADPNITATFSADINLYSQTIDWLQYYITADILGDYYFYNNTCFDAVSPAGFAGYTFAQEPFPLDIIASGTGAPEDPYVLFDEGSGTAQDPYKIKTIQDLMRMQRLYENKSDWETMFGIPADSVLYFSLAADLSLLDSGNDYFDISIPDFSGVLQGRGKSITGVINSLFVEIAAGGAVYDLKLRGEVRTGGEAILTKTNYGTLDGIFVEGGIVSSDTPEFAAGGIVYENANTISGSQAKITTFGVGEYGAFAHTVSTGTVFGCRSISADTPFVYHCEENRVQNSHNFGPIWIADDPEVFPIRSVAVYDGQSYYDDAEPYQYLDDNTYGWRWAKTPQLGYYNWCVPAGTTDDQCVLRLAGDIGTYKVKHKLLFINSSDSYQETLPYISAGYVRNVTTHFFGEAGKFSTYSWTYTSPNGIIIEHTEGFSQAKDRGVYTFYFIKDATLTETKGINTATIEIVPIDIDYQKGDLRIVSGNELLPIPGLMDGNYSPKIVRDFDADGVSYSFNESGATIDGVTLDYVDTTSHKTYKGEDFNLTDIQPFYAPDEAEYLYVITDYIDSFGKRASTNIPVNIPSIVRAAGTYFIMIIISCPNYEDSIIENVMYKVERKEVRVTPYIDTEPDRKLPYNGEIADYIGYEINEYDILDQVAIEQLATMRWSSSNYTVGSPAGEQYSYNLSASPDPGKPQHNNYVVKGQQATFKVTKIDIPNLDEVSFVSASKTYDGGYLSIAASGLGATMGVSYTYQGVAKGEPYSFIDAGNYDITAEVFMVKNGIRDTSYNLAPELAAAITIYPKNISISIQSYMTDYGEAPPQYVIDDFTDQICERQDGGVDSFGTPIFTCAPTNYVAGGNAGTYTIGLSAGSLYNPNYSINVNSGTLVVNKISRGALHLSIDTRAYNGAAFVPDFPPALNDEINAMPTTNIEYYIERQSGWDLLPQPPKDVGEYKIVITFDENSPRATNYIAEVLEATFSITKASLNIAFIVDGNGLILENSLTPTDWVYDDYFYNGETHNVEIGGLPIGELFGIFISYTYNGEARLDENVSMSFDTAGLYGNISIAVGGNPNYNDKVLYGGSILYNPRTLRLNDWQVATYTTQEIKLPLSIRNAGYVLEKDNPLTITYKSYLDGALTPILDAGIYVVEADPNNPNYIIRNDQQDGIYTFEVAKYLATINMADNPYEVVYGNISTTFKRQTTYNVGEYTETKELTYNVQPYISKVGNYNVLGANDTKNVRFDLRNGGGKYIVVPKPISFVWELEASYTYNGELRSDIASYSVPSSKIIGNVGDLIKVLLDFGDQSIKNVGVYNIVATIDNTNYVLQEDSQEFSFEITKAEIVISADDIVIDYLSAPPNYTATIGGLLGDDNADVITLVFDCPYTQGANTGTYTISILSYVSDNYYCDISGSRATLTVNPIRQTGISYPPKTETYNGKAFTYLPQGTAKGSSITLQGDTQLIDAGVYNITAVVRLANYQDKTISTTFTITRATPTLALTPATIEYGGDGRALTSADIIGAAEFGGASVQGAFYFEAIGQTLLWGEHQYSIVFEPASTNFATVVQQYTITSYKEDIQDIITFVYGSDTQEKDGILYSKGSNVNFGTNIDAKFGSGIMLYVDGEAVPSGVATITTATDELHIEIKKDGELLYEYTFKVVLNHTQKDPPIDNGGNNSGGGGGGGVGGGDIQLPKPTNWALIGGIVGGVAGGIVLILIAVKVIQAIKDKKE